MTDVQPSLFEEFPVDAPRVEVIPFNSAVYADKVAENFVPRIPPVRKLSPAAIDQGHGFDSPHEETDLAATGRYVALPSQDHPVSDASGSTYHTPREMIDDTHALLKAISEKIPK